MTEQRERESAGVAAEDAAARLTRALGVPGAGRWLKPYDTRWLLDQWRLAERAGAPLPADLEVLVAPPPPVAAEPPPAAGPVWADVLWTMIRICMVLYVLFGAVALCVAL